MNPTRLANQPFRLGAAFEDRTTGLRFEVHHPQERPDLWEQYIQGAEARYRKHGLDLVDRSSLLTGSDVSMFSVGIDESGRVVAGVRFHGPIDSLADCHALVEMATSTEIDLLTRYVERFIPYGVIEAKGAWGPR